MTTFITKEVVFSIAKQLTEQSVYPTQRKVRELLGKGSMRDIGFYLREWKKYCFTTNKDIPALQEDLALSTLEIDNLEKENKQFNKIKQQLQQQIDELTTNLKAAEHKANKFEFQTEALQAELASQIAENNKLLVQCHNCQELLQERGKNIEIMLADKNQLIYDLRQEMQETHKQAIEEIREHNQKHHDTTVSLQVENINLQEQIKAATKKYKIQEGQLLDLKTSDIQLKKLLQEKEAIISKYITTEELEDYARNNSK